MTSIYSSRYLLLSCLLLSSLTYVLSAPHQLPEVGAVVDQANPDEPDALPADLPVDGLPVDALPVNPDEPKTKIVSGAVYHTNDSKNVGIAFQQVNNTVTPAPARNETATTLKPDPAPKGSSSSVLFGVVVCVVLLMLGCLLYFMFFGSQKETTEPSIARPAEDAINQARKSMGGGAAAAKSPHPAASDPQLTVRSATDVPPGNVPTLATGGPQPTQAQQPAPAPVAGAGAGAPPPSVAGAPAAATQPAAKAMSPSKALGMKSTKSILKPAKSSRKSKA